MTEPFARRQPSDDPEELQGQLLRELSLLREGRAEEPELFRAYLQHALVLAWRGVADGHMRAPREALDCLLAARPFIGQFMPDLEPRSAAAAEIYFATKSLHLAADALAERRVEDRIADRRSATERAILQVLADNRPTFMRRGEIHAELQRRPDLPEPPTTARVGQILAELHEDNLLVRIHGRAQGNPNAAFYALSPRGIELCRDLGLIPDPVPVAAEQAVSTAVENRDDPILQAARVALDPNRDWRRDWKSNIAMGLLRSGCFGPRKNRVLQVVSEVADANPALQPRVDQVVKTRSAPVAEAREMHTAGVLISMPAAEKYADERALVGA